MVTGASDEAARRKYDEYMSYANPDGMLALYSGWTGIDFSQLDLDMPLQRLPNDALRTLLETLHDHDSGQSWTVRDVMKYRSIGGTGPTIIGGPETVADELEKWVDEGNIDGFNLAYAVTPTSVTDFIDYVLPVLRERGRVWTSYPEGPLRQKMIGAKDGRVLDSHPAAVYKTAYIGKESVADASIAPKHAELAKEKAPVA